MRNGGPMRLLRFGAAFAAGVGVFAASMPERGPSGAAPVLDGAAQRADGADEIETPAPTPQPAWVPSRADMLLRALIDAGAAPLDPGPHDLTALSEELLSPLAADVALWSRLRTDEGADWATLADFLERRPDWPARDALLRRAERAAPETARPERLRALFDGRTPETARGARVLAGALAATGDADAATEVLRAAWSTLPAPQAEHGLWIERHADAIADLDLERFDALALQGHAQSGGRIAARLDGDARAYADAVLGLMTRRRGVDGLVDAVPEAFVARPALSHARFAWRLRRERFGGAEEMLRAVDAGVLDADDPTAAAAVALGRPEAWAAGRRRLSRDAYEEGRHADAYAIAAAHGLRAGRDFAELEFFAGWMALRFLDAPDRAQAHFERLHGGVTTPISRGRAAYWAGRAAEASGDAAAARRWFEVAAETPGVFYGQLACEALGVSPELLDPAEARVFNRTDEALAAAWDGVDGELAQAATLLARAGRRTDARLFIRAMADRQSTPEEFAAVAWLARRLGDPWGEIRAAEAAQRAGVDLWSALFPTPTFMDVRERRVEPALLLAIARAESRFVPTARSGAGAQGLMQMLPATARAAARRIGEPWDRARLGSDAAYNLTLGDAHLETLLRFWDGSYVLTIASYNAGEGNVLRWIRRFGDPRDPDVDVVDWIETIPFAETRNYVQRVLEAVAVYRIRLSGGRGPMRPSADLTR